MTRNRGVSCRRCGRRVGLADVGRNVHCVTHEGDRSDCCGGVGSLSRHEDVLDRCERRVLVEPFALCSVLSS
jgi:hypothetical protein